MDDLIQVVGAATLLRIAAHHQDAQARIIAADLEGEGDALHHRHDDVGQQQIEAVGIRRRQGLQRQGAALDRDHLLAMDLQRALDEAAHAVVVFRQEDSRHGSAARRQSSVIAPIYGSSR